MLKQYGNLFGNVGIGTTAPTEALVVVGNANITGTLYKGTSVYNNPDVAEKIPSTQSLEEGDLVVVDEQSNNHVVRATSPYQNVVGVMSPNAAMVIGNWRGGFDGYNIALLGRVAVKISMENGPIKAGDPLTSSSKEGYAMKATSSGRIIGYALEDYNAEVKPIQLEGTKTDQFAARFKRDLGKKHLKEAAKSIIEGKTAQQSQNQAQTSQETTPTATTPITSASETRHPELQQNSSLSSTTTNASASANLVTGNAINEVALQTDTSSILEPASNATTEINTAQTASVAPLPQLQDENTTINKTTNNTTSATGQPEEQNKIDEIEEIETLEDAKAVYKKRKGKDLEEDKEGFEEITKAIKEKERLEAEAQKIENNAKPKILMVLSQGWNGKEEVKEEKAATPLQPQELKLDYMQKVNGSVIIRLG